MNHTDQYEVFVFMCFSQTLFLNWFDEQIVIVGKGISLIEDSLFSMSITVGQRIHILIILFTAVNVKNIIKKKANIQKTLKKLKVKYFIISVKKKNIYQFFLNELILY